MIRRHRRFDQQTILGITRRKDIEIMEKLWISGHAIFQKIIRGRRR
jgi:hypothetical protein